MGISYAMLSVLAGIILLGIGANRFVVASSQMAKYFSLPPLIAGVLLVGFGGSFPEVVVSVIAALHGQMAMAVGNAIGSNIVNIGLVLGVTALVAPMMVHRHCMRRDFPTLCVVMMLVFALIGDGILSRMNGVILLIAFVYYIGYMLVAARKRPDEVAIDEFIPADTQVVLWQAMVWWLIGLGLLFLSSELLVTGASTIAKHFGVSDLVIGLTVVAIGTSLPEFATTLMAAMKNHHDIAVGNVLGSNVFNLLAVLAMPALIDPGQLNRSILHRDFPVMIAVTLLAWLVIVMTKKTGYKITRWAGCVLLLSFVGYYLVLLV